MKSYILKNVDGFEGWMVLKSSATSIDLLWILPKDDNIKKRIKYDKISSAQYMNRSFIWQHGTEVPNTIFIKKLFEELS